MSRQLGYVLGVSILVALLGSAAGGDPVAAFEDAWVFMAIAAALGALAAFAIGVVRPYRAPVAAGARGSA